MLSVTEKARSLARDAYIPRDSARELIAACMFEGSCPTQDWLDAQLYLFPIPGRFSSPDLAIVRELPTEEFLINELRRVPHVELDFPQTFTRYEVWWASALKLNEAEHALIADRLTQAIGRIQHLWQEREPCRV